MEEFDELVPQPDSNGVLDLTHRAWVVLDNVVWTMKRELLVLNISFNNIEYLPPELGDLDLLKELDVSCNKLEALPPETGKCKRLRKLKANGNYITMVPEQLGDCLLLEEITLSENKLQEVPVCLAGLTALRVLRLQNNCLKTLPYSLGLVSTLEDLDCAGNPDLAIIPASLHSNTAMILWVCRLQQEHADEVIALEKLNDTLEAKAQLVEETKLRLKEDVRLLHEQRRTLLKERPAAYLAIKHQV
ncbi:unnamed protein product, partial [Discosporangium mesarthrocarpum]